MNKRYLAKRYMGADKHYRLVTVREEDGRFKVYRKVEKRQGKDVCIFESKNKLHLEQRSDEMLPRIVETVDTRGTQFKIALERLIKADAKWSVLGDRKLNWRFIRKVLLAGNIVDYPALLACDRYTWSKEKVIEMNGGIGNWALILDNEIDSLEELCKMKSADSEKEAEDLLLWLED